MVKNETVLVLAPHTDDGELGCGGSIAKLLENGNTIYHVAFSICEESVPEGYPKDVLKHEFRRSNKLLGLEDDNIITYNYPVRKFTYHRQEILEDIVILRNRLKPSVIFMPCSSSLHQDHITIYNEGIRAFKHYQCFGYDLPWDSTNFSTQAFFTLEGKHVAKKWEAISQYKTQNFRNYCDEEFIFGLARVRGAQIGRRYAEAFEAIRILV